MSLPMNANLSTTDLAGIMFDQYGETEFKFAGLLASTGEVVIGHHTFKGGWVIDAARDMGITAGDDYDLTVTVKGTTVSVLLNNSVVLGHAFNAVSVDGEFGLFSRSAGSSFNSVTVATNDPAYLQLDEAGSLLAASAAAALTSRSTLSLQQLTPIVSAAAEDWLASGLISSEELILVDNLQLVIRDLPGQSLGYYEDGTLYIDVDAAGHGWFVDQTPDDGSEFGLRDEDGVLLADGSSSASARIDLLTVVSHELGHLFGMAHESGGIMGETLTTGTRVPAEAEAPPNAADTEISAQLISMSTVDQLMLQSQEEVVAPFNLQGTVTLTTANREQSATRELLIFDKEMDQFVASDRTQDGLPMSSESPSTASPQESAGEEDDWLVLETESIPAHAGRPWESGQHPLKDRLIDWDLPYNPLNLRPGVADEASGPPVRPWQD